MKVKTKNKFLVNLGFSSSLWKGFLLFSIFSFFIFSPQPSQAGRDMDLSMWVTEKNSGKPLDGNYDITYQLYDQERNGNIIWEETQNYDIHSGVVTTILGKDNPFPEDLDHQTIDYYLGIIVDGDPMDSRKRLSPSLLSVNSLFSENSATLQGKTIGTEEDQIPLLGSGGKLANSLLNTGEDDDQLILGDDERLHLQNTDTGTTSNSFNLGSGIGLTQNFDLTVSSASNKPTLRFNPTQNTWQLSTDGNTFGEIVIGSSLNQSIDDLEAQLATKSDINHVHSSGELPLGNLTGDLLPTLTNTYSLGSTTKRWLNLHVQTVNADDIQAKSLTIDGGATLGAVGENVTLNSSLIPDKVGLNLGSSTNPWSSLYVDNLTVGTSSSSGTTAPFFTINTNAGDNEDSGLRFYRGPTLNTYATLKWNGTAENFSLYSHESDSTLGTLNLGGLNVGSGGLFVDSASGNIGIGTTSPGAKLEVDGDFKITGFDNVFYMNDLETNRLDSTGNGYGRLYNHVETSIQANNGAIRLKIGNTDAIHITNARNIGIGTTAPSEKLHVIGNAIIGDYTQSNTLRVTDNGIGGDGEDDILLAPDDLTLDTGNVGLKIGTAATGVSMFSSGKTMTLHSTNGNFVFQTGIGEEKMRITSSGNVGIGTTSPGAKLHVVGSSILESVDVSYPGDNNKKLGITNTRISSYNYGLKGWIDLNASGFAHTQNVDVASGNVVGFGSGVGAGAEMTDTDGEQSWLYVGPKINQSGTAAYNGLKIDVTETSLGDGSAGDGNNLLNLAVGGTSKFVVDNTGNIGIGTTSPGSRLDVTGGQLLVSGSTTWSYNAAGYAAGEHLYLGHDDVNNVGYIQSLTAGSGHDSLYLIAKDIAFRTANGNTVERLRITSDGNIGIGTTSPVAKLNVESGSDVEVARFTDETGNNIVIDKDGNLGIGTTSPNYTLQVGDDSTATFGRLGIAGGVSSGFLTSRPTIDDAQLILGRSFTSQSGGIEFSLSEAGAGYGWKIAAPNYTSGSDNQSLIFLNRSNNATWSEVMRMDHFGNIGIGTTSPGAKLDVAGDATYVNSSSHMQLFIGGATNHGRGIAIGYDTTGNYGVIQPVNTGVGYDNLILNPTGGNVGINTGVTAPGYSLVVGGKLSFNQTAPYGMGYVSTGVLGIFANNGYSGSRVAIGMQDATTFYEKMSILKNGNIGIGTTTPTAQLHTQGNLSTALTGTVATTASSDTVTGASTAFTTELAVGDAIKIGSEVFTISNILSDTSLTVDSNSAVTASGVTAYKDPILFSVDDGNETNQFYIDKSGNTRIAGDLTVIGTSTLSNIEISTDTLSAPIGTDMKFKTGPAGGSLSESLVVTDEGNIGIGTTGPGAKLQVLGSDSLSTSFAANISGATGTGLVVKNNGNIGIGTTTPSAKLQVLGSDSLSTSFAANISGATGTGLVVKNNGNIGIGTTNPGALLDINGSLITRGDITFKSSGGTTLGTIINSSGQVNWNYGFNLAVSTGNVGIGNNNPARKLDVTGQIYSSIANSNIPGYDNGAFAASGANWQLRGGTNNSFNLDMYNSGSPFAALTVLQSGNVGIGTTTPWSKLSIKGSGTGTGKAMVVTDSANTERFVIQDNGNIGIGTTAPSAKLQVLGSDSLSTSFAANISGATGTGLVVTNEGNIGIGTTGPSAKLQVLGSDSLSTSFAANISGATGTGLVVTNEGNIGIGTTVPSAKLQVLGSDSLSTSFAANISGATGTGLVVKNNGNIGIGTTAPSAKLQVLGSDSLSTSFAANISGATGTGLVVKNNGNIGIGTTTPVAKLNVESGSDVEVARFSDELGNNVVIDKDGKVGIGTTTPVAKLHIYQDSPTADQKLFQIGTSDYSERFSVDEDGDVTIKANDSYYATMGDVSGRFTISSGRGLGFQMNGVGTLFQIVGDISYGDAFTVKSFQANRLSDTNGRQALMYLEPSIEQSGTAAYDGLRINVTETSLGDGSTGDGNNIFNAGIEGVSKFVIDRTGNIGIGTTSPGAKLEIAGTTGSSLIINNSGISGHIQWLEAGTARGYMGYGDTNNLFTDQIADSMAIRSEGALHLGSGSGADMTIANSGNIGIGTTTPWGKLSIKGAGTGTGKAMVVTDSANTERFVIQDNGNIGIGTTTPSAKLQVLGSDSLSTSFAANISGATGTGLVVTNEGNVGIGTTGPSAKLQVLGSDSLSTSFAANISGATGTGLVVTNEGNIGIGTTAPGYKLDVAGDASLGHKSELITDSDDRDFSSDTGFWNYQSSGVSIADGVAHFSSVGMNSGLGRYSFLTTSKTYAVTYTIKNYSSGSIVVGYGGEVAAGGWKGVTRNANGTYTDIIKGFARLGFFTMSGGVTLDIDDVSVKEIPAFYLAQGGYMGLGTTTLSANLTVQGGGGNIMSLLDNSGAEMVTVKNNGNIGIGTTTPVAKLNVESGSDVEVARFTDETGNNIVIDKDGNLGIGTTTPNSKLSIDGGNISLNGGYLSGDGGDEGISVDNSGNIGIGTTGPNYKLEVSGAIMLEDMTAPTASASHSGIYSNSGELYALDSAGNSTLLSPHNEEGLWHYRSENLETDKTLRIEMELLTKELDQLLGGGFVYENGERYTPLNDQIQTISNYPEKIESINEEISNLKTLPASLYEREEELAELTLTVEGLNETDTMIIERLSDHENEIALLKADLLNVKTQIDPNYSNEIQMSNDLISSYSSLEDLGNLLASNEDEEGDTIFTLTADLELVNLKTERVETDELVISEKSSGRGVIEAGESEVLIESELVDDNSRIIITVRENNFDKNLYYGEVVNGESFKVKFNGEVLGNDIEFDWILIK
jgi:hypothetical protein